MFSNPTSRLLFALLFGMAALCLVATERALAVPRDDDPPPASAPPEDPPPAEAPGAAGAPEAPRHVPETPREPGPIPIAADAALVHPPTGFVLPPSPGGLERFSAVSYDENATNISAGYRGLDPRMTVTLYIYSAHPVEEDFANSSRDVMQVLDGMRRRLSGQVENLPQPLGETHWAAFATDGPTRNFPFAASSFLSVTSVGDGEDGRPYVIKVRLTYASEHQEQVVRRMAEFIADWMEANGHDFPGIRDASGEGDDEKDGPADDGKDAPADDDAARRGG